jgi:serine/threonine protein kinase/outer membrane protein assembly factor BamD (BamD/ComL family)
LSAHGTPLDPGADASRATAAGEKKLLKLGRYEIVRELGKGAMGIVYLAKDPLIGRLVALKTIRVAAHADDDEAQEFQQRFIREAQAAGILNHPSIVTVHDIGRDEDSGTSFIAMEFVEGQNLKEVLSQGRALSFDQIGDIISQVADALDFAHAKGIVHRDVKPANIILLEGNRAKITDFGIAKIASGGANLTSTGQFLGTPNYMAPEQIKGAPVDGRTDIFALGICLYECLTRRKPFGGDSLTSISYKIVHESFPALAEVNPQIPEAYEELVANCLAKDPTKRYQRARDLGNAIRAVLRGEKPVRPADPMLAEETVVTRSSRDQTTDRVAVATPTLEVPFPEADVPPPPETGGSTRPSAGAVAAAATTAAAAAASAPTVAKVPLPKAAKAPKGPATPVGQQLRTTLTNVRTLPLWRRRIPPAIFIGIVALLVALVIGGVAAMRAGQPEINPPDPKVELRVKREKQLREEATALLQQKRFAEAHAKLAELQRLAPGSPFVQRTMQQLNAIRQQEDIGKQQQAAAQAKFDEGLALYNEKKYTDAIVRFTEASNLNPTAPNFAEYLKLAQTEEQRELAERTARKQQQRPRVATTTAPGETATTVPTATQAPPQSSTTQLTTLFNHPFVDGHIVVRAGSDIVVNERLYDDKPARFLRRATKTPRIISSTKEFPAKNADVQIWVTVPALNIQEHHVVTAFRFEPSGQHRLVVRYDPASKKFSYELN